MVTFLDRYQLAKQGRAGSALAIAAIGSFIGGTVGTMGLVLVALPLTRLALRFGPPEFFALMIVGKSSAVALPPGCRRRFKGKPGNGLGG